ncbi:MAG TPA: acyloxyacyl hydrolase [Caulobacteraceae bacterium]|nr:acyloxyacyl hydrolase [Caulobacteraceae bacterium]
MPTFRAVTLLATAAVLLLTLPVRASADVIDEVSVTGLAHDTSNINSGKESGTEDVQFEVDTVRPFFLRFLGAPRINVFVAPNSVGRTNSAGAGLVWDHRLFGPIYGSVDFGLALNDGVTNAPLGPAGAFDREHRLLLGSKVLFREAFAVQWRFARHWAIGPEFVHQSNGQILGHGANESINDAGLKLAYRFR